MNMVLLFNLILAYVQMIIKSGVFLYIRTEIIIDNVLILSWGKALELFDNILIELINQLPTKLCEEPDGKYFGLCGLYGSCCNQFILLW